MAFLYESVKILSKISLASFVISIRKAFSHFGAAGVPVPWKGPLRLNVKVLIIRLLTVEDDQWIGDVGF